ncbi:putative outer membrane protein [Pedobacter sp. BAL39]|nr:putative outer membrane protein [Pedobacter sp. BAL39]
MLFGNSLNAHVYLSRGSAFPHGAFQQDTSKKDLSAKDVQDTTKKVPAIRKKDSIVFHKQALSAVKSPDQLAQFPAVSLQQSLKGQVPGLYIKESTGEPGSIQQMYIRGISMPQFSKRDVYQSQPLVVLDGVPLISDEHPFAFDIQNYDYNRIGTATNLLAGIDVNNIEKVEVMRDLTGIAYYGPKAANGVIVLTSKQAGIQRKISFNSYFGLVQKPSITTINGEYENNFRKQFYDLYTVNGSYNGDDVYPLYLSDSLNTAYYGPSNWTNSYYRNAMIHGINADISGGSDRANFRFGIGNVKNQGIADKTGFERYSAMFNVMIKPLQWLTFSATVNGNRLDRDRNRNLRDRFAMMSYLPDLSSPLAPNDINYSAYVAKFENGFDDNFNNTVQGQGQLVASLGKFSIISRVSVDFNEAYRDLFYPRTLMEENSFASNYYGFNQRAVFDNLVVFNHKINTRHVMRFEAGQSIQWDSHKYNYAYAYKGVNDFIKLNLLESDPNNGNYLNPLAFPKQLVYRFLDRTKQNLVSYYAKGEYKLDDKYTASLLLRADASSNSQPTERWLFTPSLSLGWDVKKEFLESNTLVSTFGVRIGAGRLGRLNAYDNYAQGPQYTADIGYTGNVTVPGYNSIAVLTRPYNFGWVGYGIPWAYTDQLNIGFDLGFMKDRFRAGLELYTKNDKNQLLGIPAFAEYGYSQSFEAGMDVQNTGLDVILSADVLQKNKIGLSWTSTLNFNFNKNQLKALPGGRDELIVNGRLLKVGESVDRYWLLTNNGIYKADRDVPQQGGIYKRYNGIDFSGGDPNWADVNNDNVINNSDKSLMGNIFPKVAGGFNNQFGYGNWTLGLDLYFNLGREILNQDMANRFDFINREGMSTMSSVKEITFWEKRGDYSKYPLYNPWSSVIPYRVDQDLFLENGSFLKLRTLSLGYDLSAFLKNKKSAIERIYIYGSAHNLFTITPYSGQDPELVDYTGVDTGYGQPIPRTYTLGVRVNL